MTNVSIPTTCRRLVAAGTLALLTAAGGSAALAHGHHGGGQAWNDSGDHPPLHGPGSSHNPIVYHPSKVRPPIVKVGPAKPLPGQQTLLRCRDHRGFAGMPNVRDHRRYRPPRCLWP